MTRFRERVFGVGSRDSVHIESDAIPFIEGDSEPVIKLTLDVGDEGLELQLDEFHLTELRRVLQRAERWIARERTAKP